MPDTRKLSLAMPAFEMAKSDYENWKHAVEISEAWFLFADANAQARYRFAGSNASLTHSLQHAMRLDLVSSIYEGHIIALGLQTLPNPSDEPSRLPKALFRFQVSKIDWENDHIEGLNRQYDAVAVCWAETELANSATMTPAAPEKRGRKPLTQLFDEAVQVLFSEDDIFLDRSQEKQIQQIRHKVAKIHPGQFPGGALPGRSTVARYAKHQRSVGWDGLLPPANPKNPEN